MDNYFGDIFNVSSPMLTNYLDIVHKKVVWNVKPKKKNPKIFRKLQTKNILENSRAGTATLNKSKTKHVSQRFHFQISSETFEIKQTFIVGKRNSLLISIYWKKFHRSLQFIARASSALAGDCRNPTRHVIVFAL